MLKDLDNIKINFDGDSLLLLNIALAIIMFGVALNITIADFKRIIKNPKSVLVAACPGEYGISFLVFY